MTELLVVWSNLLVRKDKIILHFLLMIHDNKKK